MAWGRKAGPLRPVEIDRAIRRSLRAAIVGDWPTAETWLERVVEADTKDLDAYFALARLYRERGFVGRAIRMHQNLLLRGGLDRAAKSEALLELARDFDAGGYQQRAAGGYEEVLDEEPRNAEVLERLTILQYELKEYPRALALAKKLRRHDRSKAEALEVQILLAQAQLLVETGEHDGARHALKRCLRRDKNCAEAWDMVGELEAERGKTARALDAWKRAAAADRAGAGPLYPKIEASFAARGKEGEYEKYLRGILEDRPLDEPARIALGRALSSRGQATAAIEELARAIEVKPNQVALRVELGRQLLAQGQDAEALKAYADLLDALERGESTDTEASA